MSTYLFAIQRSADGVEVCSAEIEVKKVSDVTVEVDDLRARIVVAGEARASGYAPPGTPLRLCRWPVDQLTKRAVIREIKA